MQTRKVVPTCKDRARDAPVLALLSPRAPALAAFELDGAKKLDTFACPAACAAAECAKAMEAACTVKLGDFDIWGERGAGTEERTDGGEERREGRETEERKEEGDVASWRCRIATCLVLFGRGGSFGPDPRATPGRDQKHTKRSSQFVNRMFRPQCAPCLALQSSDTGHASSSVL
eukprot:866725-Pleurochrysis_carterae.AAC.2